MTDVVVPPTNMVVRAFLLKRHILQYAAINLPSLLLSWLKTFFVSPNDSTVFALITLVIVLRYFFICCFVVFVVFTYAIFMVFLWEPV